MATAPRLLILTALRSEARAVADAPGVEVHVIGLGARRMPPVPLGSRVVVAGLGGALDPTLQVGDVVIDTYIPDWPWRVGSIHTAEHAITTTEEKAALFRQTGALAVDMEQATVRRALAPDVKVIGLRSISDPADMAIDPAVLRFIDGVGRPRPLAIASTLLRRPRLLQHLLELRANSQLALRKLALSVRMLVDRFPPEPRVAYASRFEPGRTDRPNTPL